MNLRFMAIVLWLAAAVSAKDIAVSPGDSLEKARDAAQSGDRIVLHGGTYRLDETLKLDAKNSGVTWAAVPGEKPIISGGITVAGWTPDLGGRYKATVNLDNFRQLWINGKRAQRARGKIPADLKFWGKNEAMVKIGTIPPGVAEMPGFVPGDPGYLPSSLEKISPAGYATTDASLADWKNPGDMELGFFNTWSHKIAKVEKITRSDDGSIIEMSQPGFFLCNRAGGAVAQMPAYLENALELLDEPGEWYFDRPSQTLYYMPRLGENMNESDVIAPKLEKLVEVTGAHDIRFEGLIFAHATWLRPSTTFAHPEVQSNYVQPVDNSFFRPEAEKGWVPVNAEQLKSPANIVVDSSRGIQFERCTFTALGGAALDLQNGTQSSVVEGCRFEDIAANGIQVGGIARDDHHPSSPDKIVKDNRIVNNVITRIGADYMAGTGVIVGYTEGTVIAHNDIFCMSYIGISIGWGWGMTDAGGGVYVDAYKWSTPTTAKNNRIEFNHIHHVMLMLNDGAGVYGLGRQPGTAIRGNHIHDNGKSGKSFGIYLDEGSAEIEIAGNLIYNVPQPLMFNNDNQNRRASCPVHDNCLEPPTSPEAKKIAEEAGLETKFKNLLK